MLCGLLQESIRNSADGMLLSAPDSLEVSITKNLVSDSDGQPNTVALVSAPRKSQTRSFGVDGLDLLNFTYKVVSPTVKQTCKILFCCPT